MSSRDEQTARIALAMRDVIAHAVLTNERIARSIGINVVDLQTVGVILRIGATTPSELAKRTGLPSSTVTRVLDRLEARGYIRRAPDPDDRRRIVVEGLPEKLFDPNRPDPYAEITDGMRRLHENFTPEDLDVVARYLDALAAIANAPHRPTAEHDRAPPVPPRARTAAAGLGRVRWWGCRHGYGRIPKIDGIPSISTESVSPGPWRSAPGRQTPWS